ncbi:MAG: hypothetical protein LUE93_03005 [Bacteroides sp.]|nr:hypothetical protein [Bacteroides sp.]
MFRIVFHIIFLWFLLLPVKTYAFKHISAQEGLSHKRTFSIQKDNDGFI